MSDVTSQPGGPPGPAPPVPEAELQTASGPSGPRAGFWQRFGATIIDGLILVVPYVIFLLIFDQALAYALSLIVDIAYFVSLEGGPTGQTLGKRALGIRVIDYRTGGSIGYPRALLRLVVEYISGLVVLLGYLWMLWDREKQTWHDKAAGSVVVPTDAYPVQS